MEVESVNMKTFKGNMHDYIYEARKFATRIIENRKEITKSYIEAFDENVKTVFSSECSNFDGEGESYSNLCCITYCNNGR